MAEQNEPRQTSTDVLLLQLATDPGDIAEGKVNMARMGVITAETYRNFVFWDLCANLLDDEFAKQIHKSGLDHTVGLGGRGRVDTLKGASVSLGGQVHTEAEIVKPNFIVRTLDRDWEKRQREQLGVPETG